ncbi:MAG: hypothetical protein MJB14_14810 [Spirochaetes bacterium]|nr:hypothetical protein [Spirochaetota bacterium]
MKNIQPSKTLLVLVFSIIITSLVYSSDRTDALSLQKQSTEELAILEIAVKNFGTDKELADVEKAKKLNKIGNLKYNQSKYLDAKAQYNESIKLQYAISKSMASIYLKRTEVIIDDVGIDLIDYTDQPNVQKYFKIAAENMATAKKSLGMKHYTHVINACRSAKNYTLKTYTLVNKEIPEQYQKDLIDNTKKIF